MRGSLTIALLIGIIAGLVIAMAGQGGALHGLDEGVVGMAVRIAIVILIGGAVLGLIRSHVGKALRSGVVWLVAGAALTAFWNYRFELRDAGERVIAQFAPGRAVAHGRTVEVVRTRPGDFQITTQVNGVRVPMVLDTGASTVVLTHEGAVAAGLPVEMIRYTVNIDTANGRAQAAAVTLDRIAIGSIVQRGVPALIAPPGQLKVSLLGMSFLSRLQSWEVRGDRVSLHGG